MATQSEDTEKKQPTEVKPDIIETLEDLKLSLQDVLDRELNFKGSFVAARTYDVFPNPCLRVENLGQIGLPLSHRDAQALISESQQAPFGKGAETVVDKEVRNTWQLEPSKVSFDNPKWENFVDKLLREACEQLDVDFTMSQPVCELYKLLVYEPGSHFKPHQDTEKSPGMFATMIVVLPSKFTGGDVHLKHANSSRVFTSSRDSLTDITALTWYTDVLHEVKPVETGYRLALSYNLIHKTKTPKPALPSSGDAAEKKLEAVLRAWADGKVKSVPSKLLYLLEHEYSRLALKAGILKGPDATRIRLLSNVGTPLGFKFGLVNLDYYVFGCPDAPADGYDRTIVDVYREELKYMKPVNLQGEPVDIELSDVVDEIDDTTEFIPEDLPQKIRNGEYHDAKRQPYRGNDGGDIEQWHHNTLLIIWHEPSKDGVEGKKRTCKDDETVESEPEKRARKESTPS